MATATLETQAPAPGSQKPIIIPPPAPGGKPALEIPSGQADLDTYLNELPEQAPTPQRRTSTQRPNQPQEPKSVPKPTTEPKPEERPTEPTEPKTASEPSDKVADAPAPDASEPDPTQQFKTAHDLRREFRRIAKVKNQLEEEVKRLKSDRQSPQADAERRQATERLSSLEKRNQELEHELRHANYLKSSEYKEKFEKPFSETLTDAYATIKEFNIDLPDGQQRPATEKDFDRLTDLPLGEAIKEAKTMFGDAADEILSYRRKLKEIQKAAAKEVERSKSEAGEIERRRLEQSTQQRELTERAWRQANEAIVTKYSALFAPVEGDEEGNAKLSAGYAEVDKAHDPNLSIEERIARQAGIRHRAAAFGRAQHQLKQARSRIAELEQALKEYEESAPAAGSQDGKTKPSNGAADESWEKEFEKMVS